MKNSAAYVGRVGGLAIALGIGTAVFTGHGLAMADSSEGASGSAANDSSETKSATANGGAAGGATTTDKSTTSTQAAGGSTTGPDDTEATSGHATETPKDGAFEADSTAKPVRKGARHPASTSRPSSQDDKPALEKRVRPSASATNAAAQARPVDDATPSPDTKTQADEPNSGRGSAGSTPTMTARSVVQSQVVADPPEAQVTPETEGQIVTSMLTSLALGSPATTDPVAPAAPAPSLFGFLQLAWRELSRGLLGSSSGADQRPTITYDVADSRVVDGNLVGRVIATDPDSTLKLTASKPAHGDVTVAPDGTFTYTPDPAYNGEDKFKITATEMNGGSTGLLGGLMRFATFGLFGGGGRSASVTIIVDDGYTSSTVVSGLNSPTDFRFLPDGRLLFAEKGGAIRVSNGGQLQSTPLITLPTDTFWAKGLAGLEVDPDFENNGYIYVSYVRSDNYQRLSRLTVTDPTAEVLTVDPNSEVVLVQGTQPAGNDHHGGGLAFGPDGKLYWSVGDNVCCSVIDGSNSQDLSNIYGKVLRLNPDGSAPSDNPFPNASGAGPLIYATGFRNPFRLAFAPDGQLLVADVGQAEWEEVNLVTAGGDYGWPYAEGPCNGIGTADCSTPSSYDNPIYAYRHASGGNSITGVLAYADGNRNTVLIADFNQKWVKELTFNSDYSELIGEKVFGAAAPGSTNKLVQGPDGSIYQLTYDGTLTRIAPTLTPISTV
ncbi:PQQ-dependent sugar dehydrogenase [Mycobacterium sp. OAE908]|uniref:PQQ-dependent sugar dehydrogenase n=1 Tax=Mycobacterium sp. OAE908 TaxID=2817899 RepID=UPI001AEA67EB